MRGRGATRPGSSAAASVSRRLANRSSRCSPRVQASRSGDGRRRPRPDGRDGDDRRALCDAPLSATGPDRRLDRSRRFRDGHARSEGHERRERLRAFEQPCLRRGQHGDHRGPDPPTRADRGRRHRSGRPHRDARRTTRRSTSTGGTRTRWTPRSPPRRPATSGLRRCPTVTGLRARRPYPPSVGMPVQKYGRTTGFTIGIDQRGQRRRRRLLLPADRDHLLPRLRGATSSTSSPSRRVRPLQCVGRLGLARRDDRAPTTRLGCCSPGGEGLTIANPIDAVLQRFNVTIDGTPAGPGPPGARPA